MSAKYALHLGDCLDILPILAPQSVDAILTDLPYGTTQCAWDEVIPFAPMWEQVRRVLKPRGVFVTTASQPFTSKLVMSNLDWFRYEWIWQKREGTRYLDANNRPLLYHENIAVFCDGATIYNPQKSKAKVRYVKREGSKKAEQYGNHNAINSGNNGENYPKSIIEFGRENVNVHPTQKPVSLYTYLTLTYTNPGDTVLDICFGSCTTGVACMVTGRNFVGIERDPGYHAIGSRRIAKAAAQPLLFA